MGTDEQRFYQVVWGTKAVPSMDWGKKVFADSSLDARNASRARRFFEDRKRTGVPCQLQTLLWVTLRDSVEETGNGN